MSPQVPVPGEPLSWSTRQHLQAVRNALLRLHKILLDDERIEYERVHGKVTPNELLQLLLSDDHFAWLRTISGLVVRIDETLAPKKQPGEQEAQSLLAIVVETIVPAESDFGFGSRYHQAIQRTPDVLLAHGELRKLLAAR